MNKFVKATHRLWLAASPSGLWWCRRVIVIVIFVTVIVIVIGITVAASIIPVPVIVVIIIYKTHNNSPNLANLVQFQSMPGSSTTSMPGKESSKYSWPILANTQDVFTLHHYTAACTYPLLSASATLGQHKWQKDKDTCRLKIPSACNLLYDALATGSAPGFMHAYIHSTPHRK